MSGIGFMVTPSQKSLPLRKGPPVRTPMSAKPVRLQHVLKHEIRKRQDADQALRLAEHKYKSIFEHALEGIFQTSREGNYIAANPALVKMYGYDSFEELAANINNIATQLYVDPERRTEFIRLMQEHGQVLHFESEVRRRDGKTFWISENVRSIYDNAQHFLYYEGTVDDITEIKLAQEKLRRTLETLEQTQNRLEAELSEAAGYVRGLLPIPLSGAIETDWCYLPSSHLGGDGFGYSWLDPEHFAIYLLDVSGHGVGSALLSSSVLNVLRTRSLAATDFADPSAVLEGLNRTFPHGPQQRQILYDLVTASTTSPRGRFSMPAAASTPRCSSPTSTRAGISRRAVPGIGITPDPKFPLAMITVPLGAELYLFSDGVYEIARPDGTWQSWEEFAQLLQEHQPPIDSIVKRMREMHGTEEFEDDFSLLKVKLA